MPRPPRGCTVEARFDPRRILKEDIGKQKYHKDLVEARFDPRRILKDY